MERIHEEHLEPFTEIKISENQKVAVFYSRLISDQTPVAIKMINIKSPEMTNFYHQKLNKWSSFSHPNILKLRSIKMNGEETCTGMMAVFEYCIFQLEEVFNYKLTISEHFPHLSFYMHELIDAYSYLEEKNCAHNNICMENILFCPDYHIKICGISSLISNNQVAVNFNYKNIEFCSPEILTGYCIDYIRSDVFSLGLVLLRLALCHNLPGISQADEEYLDNLVNEVEDEEVKFYIKVMLRVDYYERPTFVEIREKKFPGFIQNPPVEKDPALAMKCKKCNNLVKSSHLKCCSVYHLKCVEVLQNTYFYCPEEECQTIHNIKSPKCIICHLITTEIFPFNGIPNEICLECFESPERQILHDRSQLEFIHLEFINSICSEPECNCNERVPKIGSAYTCSQCRKITCCVCKFPGGHPGKSCVEASGLTSQKFCLYCNRWSGIQKPYSIYCFCNICKIVFCIVCMKKLPSKHEDCTRLYLENF